MPDERDRARNYYAYIINYFIPAVSRKPFDKLHLKILLSFAVTCKSSNVRDSNLYTASYVTENHGRRKESKESVGFFHKRMF